MGFIIKKGESMRKCFECDLALPVDGITGSQGQTVKVKVDDIEYGFHPRCARNILSDYVINSVAKEAYLERMATSQERQLEIAESLGYRKAGDC